MRTIIIDPGHGGHTAAGKSTPGGACGGDGTREKDITLRLARRVVHHLGEDAALTRQQDINLSLADRIKLARQRGAEVFLSLHVHDRPEPGALAFVHPQAGADSCNLATALQRTFQRLGGAGVETGALAVLTPSHHAPQTAACLLELDGLARPESERRLRDPAELERMARAIAGGIREHLGAPRLGAAQSDDEIRRLALQQIEEFGGITVAAYVTLHGAGLKAKDDAATFPTFRDHARQFATDHGAIGFTDRGLVVGQDAALELKRPLTAMLDDLAERLALVDAEGNSVPLRIRDLAVFTHGDYCGLKADASDGHAAWIQHYSPFIDALAPHLAARCRLLLYACSTAQRDNYDRTKKKYFHVETPWAEGVTVDLAERLRAREGTPLGVQVETWAHASGGHTTANHQLACILSVQDVRGGRHRDDIAPYIASSFLSWATTSIMGRDTEGFSDFEAADAMEAAVQAKHGAELTKQVSAALDLDDREKSEGGRAEDRPTHPRLVFNRDLPQVGLLRLFNAFDRDWYNEEHSGVALAANLAHPTSLARKRFEEGYEMVREKIVPIFDLYWNRALALAPAERRAVVETPPGVVARAQHR